uniref:EGF-like domain-containing protein n=1 Tax=Timema poppense TaxID=170557 RepID=A0A7R9D9I9_TIMPO|nr:unnamed protein product [Timema poppensis]
MNVNALDSSNTGVDILKCHSGWKGRLCDECERYPGCLHGTCQKPWDCLCDEGWGGLFCNQDLNYCTNHKPCRHGGTCFNTGQGSYTCSCPPGHTGTDCEREVDDCATHPCLNGGTCKIILVCDSCFVYVVQDNGNSSYRCECPKGWHGPHCETSAQTCDDQPCRNSATCLDNPVGYTCQCPPGYTGVDCEHEVDDCAPGPCRNNASCVDKVNGYKCVCLTGFSGTDCEVNVDDCHGNPCLNGGTCLDLVNRFRCQCVPGYVGDLCQGKVDYCRTKPCANGGVCTDRVNDYSCECRAGFSGKDCSVDIDECGSSPCRNGGTCVNRVNGFACRCPAGLRGSVCESTEAAAAVVEEEQGTAGNISRHVSEQEDEGGLSTEHVVVIATLSTAVPTLVLVGAIVVMCMKQRRKRERQRADDEARMQNEQNAVHSSMAKRGSVLVGAGDAHMIKNTWGKCVNNVPVGHNSPPEEGGGPGESETCYPKQACPPLETGPVYTLQRTRSHKQLNTDRHSNRGSGLLHPHKGENLCPGVARTTTPGDKRHSVMSVDSSHCNSSDPTLLKRPHDKDSSSSLLSAGVGASSVYVIDEHFQDGLLATEV